MPIYQPKSMAREFSPYALTIYKNCPHRCQFCYVPKITFNQGYFSDEPQVVKNLLDRLRKQLSKTRIREQVHLSFIGDPYNQAELTLNMTRQALEILLEHNVPVAILTKGGENCLKDLDIFKAFGTHIKVGQSLTFWNVEDSLKFEPGAAWPACRFEALKELHGRGIMTWASLEPVIDPEQSLKIIEITHEYVDSYKVGKINHWPEIEQAQDWDWFLKRAVDLLRSLRKPFYVKHSLQVKNISTELRPVEIDQDFLNVV